MLGTLGGDETRLKKGWSQRNKRFESVAAFSVSKSLILMKRFAVNVGAGRGRNR